MELDTDIGLILAAKNRHYVMPSDLDCNVTLSTHACLHIEGLNGDRQIIYNHKSAE